MSGGCLYTSIRAIYPTTRPHKNAEDQAAAGDRAIGCVGLAAGWSVYADAAVQLHLVYVGRGVGMAAIGTTKAVQSCKANGMSQNQAAADLSLGLPSLQASPDPVTLAAQAARLGLSAHAVPPAGPPMALVWCSV